MSFLNKYKFHYHNKQLEVLFKSEDYLKLLSYLEKLSDQKNKLSGLILSVVKIKNISYHLLKTIYQILIL